jgi:hypothetical protein
MVKNIPQIVLISNKIKFNQRLSGLIGLCSGTRNEFLPPTVTRNLKTHLLHNGIDRKS